MTAARKPGKAVGESFEQFCLIAELSSLTQMLDEDANVASGVLAYQCERSELSEETSRRLISIRFSRSVRKARYLQWFAFPSLLPKRTLAPDGNYPTSEASCCRSWDWLLNLFFLTQVSSGVYWLVKASIRSALSHPDLGPNARQCHPVGHSTGAWGSCMRWASPSLSISRHCSGGTLPTFGSKKEVVRGTTGRVIRP